MKTGVSNFNGPGKGFHFTWALGQRVSRLPAVVAHKFFQIRQSFFGSAPLPLENFFHFFLCCLFGDELFVKFAKSVSVFFFYSKTFKLPWLTFGNFVTLFAPTLEKPLSFFDNLSGLIFDNLLMFLLIFRKFRFRRVFILKL